MKKLQNNRLSISEARTFLINYQGLNTWCKYEQERGVLEYFKKVGCIQYDPLNMVGRNSDLVLQARIKDYSSETLDSLLYEKRSLIDAWDKMMSIYQQVDWPYFKRIREFKGIEQRYISERRNSKQAFEFLDEIKNHILENGPIVSSQVDIGKSNPGSWGHRKLSSVALDYLFNIGEIGVYKKKNTQKIYDLIENLLPKEILRQQEPFATEEAFHEWYVKRRIGSVGMLWERSGGAWLGYAISDRRIRNKAIKSLLEQEQIEEFYVEDIKYPFFIRKEDAECLNETSVKEEVKFLAPLDNLLWDRTLIKQIFHFDYTWEVYTPIEKRKYGYYVLPVLYGNKFIARFEPEMYRGEKELRIKNWWWEEDVSVTEDILLAIQRAFENFCEYLGADYVAQDDLIEIIKAL